MVITFLADNLAPILARVRGLLGEVRRPRGAVLVNAEAACYAPKERELNLNLRSPIAPAFRPGLIVRCEPARAGGV
jgi:hypothetical protein